jgi:hypothetical protein
VATVVATARDPERARAAVPGAGDALLTIGLDVTDEDRARAAVSRALDRSGRIDVVVNNAALALVGAVEEASAAPAGAALGAPRQHQLGRRPDGQLGLGRLQRDEVRGGGPVRGDAGRAGAAGRRGDGGRTGLLHPRSGRSERPARVERHRRLRRDGPGRLGTAPTVDPVKAAAAIIELVGLADPPARLLLGSDCVERVEAKLGAVHRDLAASREAARAADHRP